MASVTYLDTHVVAWLYQSGAALLSPAAVEAVERADELRISPMVRLELHYLFEIRRVRVPAVQVVDELAATVGLRLCDTPLPDLVVEAERYAFTRDPFDRLIVAQASLRDAPLVTRDEGIRAAYEGALW